MNINAPLKDRPHFVYRIFDAEDRLLYVGCAENVESRIYLHQQISSQFPVSWEIARRIDRYTSQKYPNEQLAHEAERRAIESEIPLLNRQHNPRRFKRVNGRYVALEQISA